MNTIFMNSESTPVVIGIDHGYANIKTAHTCFQTGVAAYDKEPTFKNDLLVYNGKYYSIGEDHKEFLANKMMDEDYYILTLAAIGREMNIRQLSSARVHLAVGLPLTWVSEQKDEFRAYLLKNEAADFSFRGKDYHVEFVGADVFPQGFSAVADRLRDFRGVNMLCDIGNGTSSKQAAYPSPRRTRQGSVISLLLLLPTKSAILRGPLLQRWYPAFGGHVRSPRGMRHLRMPPANAAGGCVPCRHCPHCRAADRQPAQTCRRQLSRRDGRCFLPVHFLFRKRNKNRRTHFEVHRKGNYNQWPFIILKQRPSVAGPDAPPALPRRI